MDTRLEAIIALLIAALFTGCTGSLDFPTDKDELDGGLEPDASDSDGDLTPPSCETTGCPDGQECVSGFCVDSDPCVGVTCEPGERCIDGLCVPEEEDPCADVICSNPGEVCSNGLCVAGESDEDGDGFRARDDCDDHAADVYPGATEICNGRDDNCNMEVDEGFDADGDRRTTCGGGDPAMIDCDDADPNVFPGAPETCNGRDDDCDGTPDNGPIDVGMPCGSDTGECAPGTTACRDGAIVCDGGVNPAAELCDGLDNDCDGVADNGIADRACSGGCGTGTERCVGGTWVCDAPAAGVCTPGESQEEPCDCGFRTRTCTGACIWSDWSGCSSGPCWGGAVCCGGMCLMDINNCGACGAVCPAGYRGSCCASGGGVGCCPDAYPICGGDGYCYSS